MKEKKGFYWLVLLFGLSFLASNPLQVWGASSTEGNVWDPAIDSKPYPGVSYTGPLSIYYADLQYIDPNSKKISPSALCYGDYKSTIYYTVQLDTTKQLYTFQGKAMNVCYSNTEQQIGIIKGFLGTVVVPGIFSGPTPPWKLKSIQNASYHSSSDDNSFAFVADIEVVVDSK